MEEPRGYQEGRGGVNGTRGGWSVKLRKFAAGVGEGTVTLSSIPSTPIQFLAGEDEGESGASPGGVSEARGSSWCRDDVILLAVALCCEEEKGEGLLAARGGEKGRG
jgi:hypothetical protein